jgi:hypothetical protein
MRNYLSSFESFAWESFAVFNPADITSREILKSLLKIAL